MNIRLLGPNVPLATAADTSDGLLDLRLIRETDHRSISDYLEGRLHLASGAPPDSRSATP